MALSSPPTNAYGLYQYVAQRIPGYDPSEYLRELNSAYIHVWEEVTKLKNHYFEAPAYVTTLSATNQFDLLYNNYAPPGTGSLSSAVDPRLYQISLIRVLPPGSTLWQTSRSMSPTDPDYLSLASGTSNTVSSGTPTLTGPYYWWLNGKGVLQFAIRLAIGTQLEITYTFWPLALTYTSVGTISSIGSVITGTGTAFTQLVQPDFYVNLPFFNSAQEINAELIVPGEPVANVNQVYKVSAITTDTALSTLKAPAPVLAGSAYTLSIAPDIPREHIRVIASVALAKMFSVDGDDQRVREWTGIAASNMQMMKDSLIERQSNNPPTKQRFPYGIGRRNRTFLR